MGMTCLQDRGVLASDVVLELDEAALALLLGLFPLPLLLTLLAQCHDGLKLALLDVGLGFLRVHLWNGEERTGVGEPSRVTLKRCTCKSRSASRGNRCGKRSMVTSWYTHTAIKPHGQLTGYSVRLPHAFVPHTESLVFQRWVVHPLSHAESPHLGSSGVGPADKAPGLATCGAGQAIQPSPTLVACRARLAVQVSRATMGCEV